MLYSDVVNANKILPKKEKYTKADMDKLVAEGASIKEARFICLCSAAFHDTECSNTIHKAL